MRSNNIQKIWTNSYAHERIEILKKLGISDKFTLKKLCNHRYVELDAEIRFQLEQIQDVKTK